MYTKDERIRKTKTTNAYMTRNTFIKSLTPQQQKTIKAWYKGFLPSCKLKQSPKELTLIKQFISYDIDWNFPFNMHSEA
jgi:hypothetical protein